MNTGPFDIKSEEDAKELLELAIPVTVAMVVLKNARKTNKND